PLTFFSSPAHFCVPPGAEAPPPRQLAEERNGFVGDSVFGVVEEYSGSFKSEALASFGIIFEQRSKMHVADTLVMSSQRLPTFAVGQLRLARRGHDHAPS